VPRRGHWAHLGSGLLLAILWRHDLADARTWRIAADGTGDAPTIQAGIDSADAGDTVALAAGNYAWSAQGANGASMLRMTRTITLRGESGATSTVLDAESRGQVLQCVDVGGAVVEDLTFVNGLAAVAGAAAAELWRSASEPPSKTALDRTLTAGDTQGGAIDVRGASTPVIRRCTFRDNRASGGTASGGAIACAQATIEDCDFTANRAGVAGPTNGRGGAIQCQNAVIARCTFRDNVAWRYSAVSGGAVHGMSPTLTDCSFENNFIECPGAPRGGAVRCTGAPTITGCVFRGNRVLGHYTYATGGAAEVASGTVRDCLFIDNVVECYTASGRGGALSGADLNVTRCIFVGNEAEQSRPLGPGQGGAIYAYFTSTIEQCTFVGNRAGTAQGIAGLYLAEGGTVRACVAAHNATGGLGLGIETWICCDLFGNSAGDTPPGINGGGNFALDPLFCSPDPVGSGDVTIRADSPCAPGTHPVPGCASIGAGAVGCTGQPVTAKTWSQVKNAFRPGP
jgi:predicted outer membrane repeat protein